ncbi:hypothetical protein BgiMline_024253 [Biomphalaria glabrata]|nr:hypothetical protein BgiMline_007453 [Biomphalaria glabrata]
MKDGKSHTRRWRGGEGSMGRGEGAHQQQQHVEAASDELACRVALIVSNLHGVSWLRKKEEVHRVSVGRKEEVHRVSVDRKEEVHRVSVGRKEEVHRVSVDRKEEVHRVSVGRKEEVHRVSVDRKEEVHRVSVDRKEEVHRVSVDRKEEVHRVSVGRKEEVHRVSVDRKEEVHRVSVGRKEEVHRVSVGRKEEVQLEAKRTQTGQLSCCNVRIFFPLKPIPAPISSLTKAQSAYGTRLHAVTSYVTSADTELRVLDPAVRAE